MAQFFQIHQEHPQPRLVRQAVEIIAKGGLVVYPTDSSYALGCQIGNKEAMERIRMLRRVDAKHHFTLVCRDLSEIATYAKIGNSQYRLLKTMTPGAFTFICQATSQVPKRLMHAKRKTIGIRVPDNRVAQAMLEELGEPIMSSTLILPGEQIPMSDPYEIRESSIAHAVDLIIDGGYCGVEPTTVIDLETEPPQVLRQGKGDAAFLELE
jgi:tRNA threonylcarbamoyl adenosine modification protein (Sua5/YciO/YrdC/YwlC family)